RLRCKDVPIASFRAMTPLKYIDVGFLDAKREGPVQTDTGFDLDLSYKDPELVEAFLRAYHEWFPNQTRLVELGRSHGDRPIFALVISNDIATASDKRVVLLDGGIHGSEPVSVEVVLDAIRFVLENPDDP